MQPALAAFGGWAEADWFPQTLLSDPGIVAFEFPRVPGLRRQGFHVVERSETRSRKAKARTEAARVAKRPAGKLAVLIEGMGAVRALSSCRSRLLFEGPPVLFFAEVPAARLGQRAVAKLRRELAAIGMRACVLRFVAQTATLVFWPSEEASITTFLEAASPELPLATWDVKAPRRAAEADARVPPGAKERSARPDRQREAALLRQIGDLQARVDELSRSRSSLGAMEQLGLDDARLKTMLKLLHPDRHGNSEAANDAAKWLNGLRDLLKGKATA
jgi:hypothetical protein